MVLKKQDVSEWMDGTFSPYVRSVLFTYEQREDWVEDRPDTAFENVLLRMGEELQRLDQSDLEALRDENVIESLYVILAFVSFPRFLRLAYEFECKDVALSGPECVPDQPEQRSVILQRIELLTKLSTYQRLFGPDRRQEVLTILDQMDHGSNGGGES